MKRKRFIGMMSGLLGLSVLGVQLFGSEPEPVKHVGKVGQIFLQDENGEYHMLRGQCNWTLMGESERVAWEA